MDLFLIRLHLPLRQNTICMRSFDVMVIPLYIISCFERMFLFLFFFKQVSFLFDK